MPLRRSYARRVAATLVPCVGAVVRDGRGRVLLVRRGNDPGRGLWSVPGGRVEPGEDPRTATLREVEEEAGVRVVLEGLAGTVERPGPGGVVYVIDDFFAQLAPEVEAADVSAGDDASDVGWFAPAEIPDLDCVDGLVEALRAWEVVPPG